MMRGLILLKLAAVGACQEISYKLSLLPANPLSQQLYRNASLASWGGTVVHSPSDTKHHYHLFAAAFSNGCGLDGWESNSFVMHAVADTPEGPFEYHDTALPVWHHNPHALLAPDGTWLIYSIGKTNASWAVSCNGHHEPVSHNERQIDQVEIHYASSPYGPWQLQQQPDGDGLLYAANPSPLFLPNGSVVVVGTGFGGPLHVAFAETWRGPYRSLAPLPFSTPAGLLFEDPGLFYDRKVAKFKILMHQYRANLSYVGGYAESVTDDFFGAWDYNFYSPAYNATITFTNGLEMRLHRRERPKVLLDSDGAPAFLYNGVCGVNVNSDCFTFVQAIQN